MTEIPEDPTPLTPVPEENVPTMDIPEEDVPLATLPEEEVPLVVLPVTRDASALWMALNALSGAGLAILGRKKRDEE